MPVTNYVWDPLSDNVLLETDENDVTQAVYTQEPDTFGNLISQRRDAETSWYHFDGLGSTRELTNDLEEVTDTNMYDAWGVNVASTGTTENPFLWVGEYGYYDDPETGDYSIRARMYGPEIARWLSVDPLYGHFHHTVDKYAITSNSPVDTVDESGLKPRERCFIAGYDLLRPGCEESLSQKGGPVKICYTRRTLSNCQKFALTAIRGAYVPLFITQPPCSRELFRRFVDTLMHPLEYCPLSCITALHESKWLHDQVDSLTSTLLNSVSCSMSGRIYPPVTHRYGGPCQDPWPAGSDLSTSIGAVDLATFSLAGMWTCGLPEGVFLKCCDCVVNGEMHLALRDKYDFISTTGSKDVAGLPSVIDLQRNALLCAPILEHAGVGTTSTTKCNINKTVHRAARRCTFNC